MPWSLPAVSLRIRRGGSWMGRRRPAVAPRAQHTPGRAADQGRERPVPVRWRVLVRTEGLFFTARERHDAGVPADWAGLAQNEGFADPAHLVRAARRLTGFSPTETRRCGRDEVVLAQSTVGRSIARHPATQPIPTTCC
jgi:AraC-like DNA-binding protein